MQVLQNPVGDWHMRKLVAQHVNCIEAVYPRKLTDEDLGNLSNPFPWLKESKRLGWLFHQVCCQRLAKGAVSLGSIFRKIFEEVNPGLDEALKTRWVALGEIIVQSGDSGDSKTGYFAP